MNTLLHNFSNYNFYLATNSKIMDKICSNIGFKHMKVNDLPKEIIMRIFIKRMLTFSNILKILKMNKRDSVAIYCKLKSERNMNKLQ